MTKAFRHRMSDVIFSATHQFLYPDFFVIGAAKAGTNWLFENLKRHSEVFIPENKEPHFYNNLHKKDQIDYARIYAGRRGKLRGDCSPSYAILSPEIIKLMKKQSPDSKIIFIMRNIIDRTWSHALMRFMLHQKRNFEDVHEQEFHEFFSSDWVKRQNDYVTIIKNWSTVYGEENLLLLFYDDLLKNPRTLFESVLKFLHLEDLLTGVEFPIHKKFFSGPEISIPDKYRKVLSKQYEIMIRDQKEFFYSLQNIIIPMHVIS